MEKLEHELAALRARAAALNSRYKAAEQSLVDAEAKLQTHLLEADLDADEKVRVKLEATAAACALSRDNLAKALAAQSAKIGEVEDQLAAEHALVVRVKAADALSQHLDRIEKALPAYLTAARQLSEAVEPVAHFHFETNQLGTVARNWAAQVDVAGALALQELRQMAAQIKSGAMPIPPAKPEHIPAATAVTPPTMTVFMIRSARFRDHEGHVRFAGQYEDAIMPVATAQKAMRLGHAVTTADPRRAMLRGARGSDYRPDGPDVVDLDAVEGSPGTARGGIDPVLQRAGFVEIDRSAEARTITIEVPRV